VENKKLPYTQVIIGTGEPIEECDLVEFRLLYEGELLSSGNKGKPRESHAIRRIFHPQLRRLWTVENNLRHLAMHSAGGHDARKVTEQIRKMTEQERFDLGIKTLGERCPKEGGYRLVPLVTEDMALRCSLDILLLRPEEKKLIFESGDIDGQLKTLFDALRIPKNLSQTGGIGPQEDETPFFCFLEDDRLITEVRVTTDKLLLLPEKKEIKPNDSFVVIHVKLNHRSARTFDNYFG